MGEEQTASADSALARKRAPSTVQSLTRWLLGLWWVFVVALGGSIAQYLGNHGGPLLITAIPQFIADARHAPLGVQAGLTLTALTILLIAVMLTWLAWMDRNVRAQEEEEAASAVQKKAFGQALDEHAVPQIEETKAVAKETLGMVKGIAERESRPAPLFAGVSFTPVRDLQRKNFHLGNDSAANFPYIREPIAAAFDAATRALRESAAHSGSKHGILVLGEANAGKTRLAFESLTETLPDWVILQWSEARQTVDIPPVETIAGRKVVLFVDDAQNYAGALSQSGESSAQAISIVGAALRTIWETLRSHAGAAILVATCRSEDERRTRAALGWLFSETDLVAIPSFSVRGDDPPAALIIHKFEAHGDIQVGAWDGTLGSLVLGLGRKCDEYTALMSANKPAVYVLKSMKLLTLAGVRGHTHARVRQVCSDIFGYSELLTNDAQWDTAVDDLLRLQFASEEVQPSGELALVIRKDSYFDAVVTDYPHPQRLPQFRKQRLGLRSVFVNLSDAAALFYLGDRWSEGKEIGDYEQALAAYDAGLALDPLQPVIWNNRGWTLLLMSRYDQAIQSFEKALAIEPRLAMTLNNKGVALIGLKQPQEALATCVQALALDPGLALAWCTKGTALADLHLNDEAVEAYQEALRLDPQMETAWHNLGISLQALERHEEAAAAFAETVRLLPRADTWADLGRAQALSKRHAEAVTAYAEALKLDPHQAGWWIDKGMVLALLGRDADALVAVMEALKIDPTSLGGWRLRGNLLWNIDHYAESLVALEEAVALDAQNAEILSEKGRTLNALERYTEALDDFNRSMTIEVSPLTLVRKFKALRALGREDEALITIEQALLLDAQKPQWWVDKGNVLCALGRFEEAVDAYGRALELDARLTQAWASKGFALYRLARYAEVIEAFSKVLQQYPNEAQAWSNVGGALYHLKRYEEAVEASEKALALDPHLMEPWLINGYALDRLGRYEEAVTAYTQLLTLDPSRATEWRSMAKALIDHMQRYSEALEACERAITLEPASVSGWSLKGDALTGLSKGEAARDAHEHAISLPATKWFEWFWRGRALNALGRHPEALHSFDQALTLEASDADTWEEKAKALRALGREDEARQAEEQAHALREQQA